MRDFRGGGVNRAGKKFEKSSAKGVKNVPYDFYAKKKKTPEQLKQAARNRKAILTRGGGKPTGKKPQKSTDRAY